MPHPATTMYPFAQNDENTKCQAVSLSNHMTLRNACVDYRDSGGVVWDNAVVPEMSGATSKGQVSCMNHIDNNVGIVVKNTITCFTTESIPRASDMIVTVRDLLEDSVRAGTLWCLVHTREYELDKELNTWLGDAGALPQDTSTVLDQVSSLPILPLSVSTSHAAMEAARYSHGCDYDTKFMFPHNAVPSHGIIGTLHDTQVVDMCPGEVQHVPDHSRRQYADEYIGYLCAGHTSHSSEAGRIRRVTSDIRVRVINDSTLERLSEVAEIVDTHHLDLEWTLFCMGKHSRISTACVDNICKFRRTLALGGCAQLSVYVHDAQRLIVIHVASGNLLKVCTNGYLLDNAEAYTSCGRKWYPRAFIDTTGKDSIRSCFSTFFSLAPYVSSNRAPRPLISSVQLPQAICLPWCPGTAAVSPVNTFTPLVTTPTYEAVTRDFNSNDANIASLMPGENVGVLFLNMEHNYEDAVMVSSRYLDLGGFSSISICHYALQGHEYVPPVGSQLCGILCRWWKSPCVSWCTHQPTELTGNVKYVAGSRCITGVVDSVTKLDNGDVSVAIRSYQQARQGDKLSTWHGQKGVVVETAMEDMPLVYDHDGTRMYVDVVYAMSSVVTRQTNGQLYEACESMCHFANASRTGPRVVVQNGDRADTSAEFSVFNGKTGRPFVTATYDSNGISFRPTKATFGYVRMFPQTQMSRERHHVSHLSMKENTKRTPQRRTRGGGVQWGEMEVMSAVASGLHHCNDEIVSRGDVIDIDVCSTCQRLGLLCKCTTENYIRTSIPYDTVVTDITSRIVHNCCFKYDLEIKV